MENYNNDHQLIIKSFPFVKFVVKINSYEEKVYYYKTDKIFKYTYENHWAGWLIVFNITNNIKHFLENIYSWLKEYYDKL